MHKVHPWELCGQLSGYAIVSVIFVYRARAAGCNGLGGLAERSTEFSEGGAPNVPLGASRSLIRTESKACTNGTL